MACVATRLRRKQKANTSVQANQFERMNRYLALEVPLPGICMYVELGRKKVSFKTLATALMTEIPEPVGKEARTDDRLPALGTVGSHAIARCLTQGPSFVLRRRVRAH